MIKTDYNTDWIRLKIQNKKEVITTDYNTDWIRLEIHLKKVKIYSLKSMGRK